eukprot:4084798-Amphidinium_carterae.1
MVHKEEQRDSVSNQRRRSCTNYTTSTTSWTLHGDQEDIQVHKTLDHHQQDGLQNEAPPRRQYHHYRRAR